MAAATSTPELLTLHGVRLLGMAQAAQVARRFGLDRDEVEELLLDAEALGQVSRASFADLTGWGLTDRGRAEDDRRLAAELDEAGAREVVTEAHATFARLNARFLDATTRWQIRPTPWDRMAANEHDDWSWDERVLDDLRSLGRRLQPLGDTLAGALDRFAGYPDRYAAALARVDGGERRYVDEPRIDSCHTVWFELHEDLLGTLGLERGGDR
jgi:hypothetical protein